MPGMALRFHEWTDEERAMSENLGLEGALS